SAISLPDQPVAVGAAGGQRRRGRRAGGGGATRMPRGDRPGSARRDPARHVSPDPGLLRRGDGVFKVSSLETPAEKAKQDEDEDIEVKTFTLGEAREMMRRGEISDMKTLVGLRLI